LRLAPQLLTYPDSLGGDLASIRALLDGPLAGLFGGVHVLPPFPSSGDRGFAPVTYRDNRPALRSWDDVRDLAVDHDVLLDLIVQSHLVRATSSGLPAARPTLPAGGLFITLRQGLAGRPHRRRRRWPHLPAQAGPPFHDHHDRGQRRAGDASGPPSAQSIRSEQVDLDLRASTTPCAHRVIADWLTFLASRGVTVVRLDAVGYVVKKAGTSCFMVEPEILGRPRLAHGYPPTGWVSPS